MALSQEERTEKTGQGHVQKQDQGQEGQGHGGHGQKRGAPYGSWESPITASFITSQSIRLSSLDLSEDKASHLFWVEGRPQEKGRQCVVQMNCVTGDIRDSTPADRNARSRVHEYGGGQSVTIGNTGDTITSDFATNDLIRTTQQQDGTTVVCTMSTSDVYRYADMFLDPQEASERGSKSRLMYAVREDHTVDQPAHVVNSIVALSVDEHSNDDHVEVVLVNSCKDPNTMYSSPRVDPSGKYLCWVQWQHPNMPWDVTELCIGKITPDGRGLTNITVVAGGENENVSQPRWVVHSGGRCTLLYLSDKADGWWNIHKAELQIDTQVDVEDSIPLLVSPVLLCKGYEFGPPAWVFGAKTYDVIPSTGQIICTWHYNKPSADGHATESVLCAVICSIDDVNDLHCDRTAEDNCTATMSVFAVPHAHPTESPAPYALSSVTSLVASSLTNEVQDVYLIGGSPASPMGVYKLQYSTALIGAPAAQLTLLKSSMSVLPDPGYISHPQHIQFPTRSFGKFQSESESPMAHGLFYPPANVRFGGDEGSLPPLLVKIHGGPTGQTSTICRLDIQFFTSRGIAVLDVDYGGSTGYGREYRNRLKGTWGLTDVEDCCRGAEHLVALGLVDGSKLCIDGGSAGGFTALACIAFRDTFKAATSSYGIGDLEALASDTHKFESRYLDNLVGPYPEAKKVFEERSAMRHASDISCPILLLQGADDKVVLPNQATMMFEAVTAKKIPAAIVIFDGEGHGWRQAETIQRALNLELNFYGLIFGFIPDIVVDVPVVNMGK